MKITKFGHCCLLIKEMGLSILIDPGSYLAWPNAVREIDIVLITQEHPDHLDLTSLKKALVNNPKARIFTNRGVSPFLDQENIKCELLEHGQNVSLKGVAIEAFGKDHALIHSSIPPVPNTGYFIAHRFFYPGDALTNPGQQVEILALPVAGPWLKLPEAIDYAIELKPKFCFPVHDGNLKSPVLVHRLPAQILEPKGIKFMSLENGQEYDYENE